MTPLADLHVLVLGLGNSGLAMARWCASRGAKVQVWDSREDPPQAAVLRESLPEIGLHSGLPLVADLAGVQLLLKSPGLAPGDERIAPLLAAAQARGIAVAAELDLFVAALADLKAERGYSPKLLAITGTNGKTTTTAMCALLVGRCGFRVAVAGNIGPTMLDTLAQVLALEPVRPAQVEETGLLATACETPIDASIAGSIEPTGEIADPCLDTLLPGPFGDVADELAAVDPEPSVSVPAGPVFEHLPEVWVLELSSFQLDSAQGFEPDAATVLNLSPDHLDWHGSMAAYIEAKSKVFGERSVMVINRDDLQVEAMVPAPVLVKGGRGRPTRSVGRKVFRFGLDAPQRPGDFGLVVENGIAWLVRAREVDETLKRRRGEDQDEEIYLQRLMPADALRVRGRHNAANALAALALACAIGCPLAPMLHGLREYRGEPHRVEFVARVGDVEVFDDSKGTNVGATVAALSGLGADQAPAKLLAILGGDGKGQDFSALAQPVARHARAVALIGRDAGAIDAALAADPASAAVPRQRHDSLQDAVNWCFDQAQAGDALLLSPACASLDMFRNYGHRAEVFVAAVQARAAERGEAVL
jgi:UDP-N-acetylmuramoylalanine--D-glutamate ligase